MLPILGYGQGTDFGNLQSDGIFEIFIRGIVISPQLCVPENGRLMEQFQKLTSMVKLAT